MKNLALILALLVAWPVLAQDGGKWEVEERTNKMSGKPEVFLTLKAENAIPGYIRPITPVLVVRCLRGEVEVHVNVEVQVQHAGVHVKLDGKEPGYWKEAGRHWREGTSGDALFVQNAKGFAKNLAKSKTFLFEFTPFQRTEQVVEFDVRGLDKHLGKVAAACGWKLE